MTINNIETEIKFKIQPAKMLAIVDLIELKGFKGGKKEKIIDSFLSINKAVTGGWDFIRLRSINDKYFYKTVLLLPLTQHQFPQYQIQ